MDLKLRADRVRFLEYLADRDGTSVSRALGTVIDFYAPVPTGSAVVDSRERERKHVWIDQDHLAVIDRLAVEWGILRSDVVARLIDEGRRRVPVRAFSAAHG